LKSISKKNSKTRVSGIAATTLRLQSTPASHFCL
jgi:hypothetical protein